MPTVRDSARVTHSAKPKVTPNDEATEIMERAWLVYTSMREECGRKGSAPLTNPEKVDGWRFEGSVQRIIGHLFPEAPSISNTEAYGQFARPIYAYLKATHNAENLVRGGGAQKPVWWVRDQWNDTSHVPSTSPGDDGSQTTGSEVTIRCSTCQQEFTDSDALSRHRAEAHAATAVMPMAEAKPPVESQESETPKEPAPSIVDKKVICCGITFPMTNLTETAAYARHRQAEHGVATQCRWCDRIAADKRGIRAHERAAHPEEYDKSTGVYRCRIGACNESFSTLQAVGAHRSAHLESKEPIPCPICGVEYPGYRALNGHKTTHRHKGEEVAGVAPSEEVIVRHPTGSHAPVEPEVTVLPTAPVTTVPPANMDLSSMFEAFIATKVAEASAGLLARAEAAERRAQAAEEQLAQLRSILSGG